MTPDKLERWLARERPRAAYVRILALQVASEPIQVHEWTLPELNAESNRAGHVLDICTDYCDGKNETVQFRIEMLDHEQRTITVTHHRGAPTETDGLSQGQLEADRVSVHQIIAQFMRHDEQRERLMVTSMEAFFKSCANIVGMQGKILDQQQASLQLLQTQLAEARAAGLIGRDLTEEEKAEAIARANAWDKAAALGPVFLEALAERWQRGHGSNDSSGSNGKAQA